MPFPILIPLVMAAIGAGINAVGQIKAGNQAKRVGEANAVSIEEATKINLELLEEGTAANVGILQYNAKMIEAQARDAITRGLEDETRFRIDLKGLIGSQRASYAGQGVDVNSDTALDIQVDSAFQGELDALTIRTNASREAWGFRVEAENTRMQSRAMVKSAELQKKSIKAEGRAAALNSRLTGQYTSTAARWGAGSTILTGAAQAYGTYRATRAG